MADSHLVPDLLFLDFLERIFAGKIHYSGARISGFSACKQIYISFCIFLLIYISFCRKAETGLRKLFLTFNLLFIRGT